MAVLNNSNAISTGGYDINNSLRFRASASAYLSRTPASAGSTTLGTFSNWLKLGVISTDRMMYHVAGTSGNNNRFYITFSADNTLNVIGYNSSGSVVLNLNTTQVFRDPSAWYHVVVAIDTTQATAANRIKLYVNGNQVTVFSTATYPAQNQALGFTNNTSTLIGSNQGVGNLFDGYMAEVNWIDGQALTPSSFGETDTTTGSWKPKAYTSTYGTNGFYLKFSDIATTSGSNAGLGKDFSGNANYFTTNNISVTSGTTYDAMIDSPTLTSATVANYAVINPIWKNSNIILAGGNLNVTSSGNGGSAISTIAMSSGKYYCEVRLNSVTDATNIGIVNSLFNPSLSSPTLSGANAVGYYPTNGDKFVNGTQSSYGASCSSGDILGIALDVDGGTLTYYKNNVSQGAITHGLTGPFFYATSDVSSGSNIDQSWNFGQRPFTYTPPTGFVRLNTYNLPDSTIKKGNTVMDATLYTGNSSTQTITNAGAFKPDLVWLKCRSTAGTWNNWIDSVRGTSKTLYSNTTNAEGTDNYLSAFNSNGFGLNTGDSGTNTSGNTYVGWQWQAGQGTNTTNTAGSITSTVSVNATAGFSIVTYTGTGANATVGHGLEVAPKMIIVKSRSTAGTNWAVYHASLGATGVVALDTTIAFTVISTPWNNTAPTSSVFTVGTSGDTNLSTRTYVAYCWAEIAGFSKFGSYTGNGTSDGPFSYTGFRPAFVMLKRTDSTSDWLMLDNKRGPYNVNQPALIPNTSQAEITSTYEDFLSNGFKFRDAASGLNVNGGTYIYMAFAENPFKYSNAR